MIFYLENILRDYCADISENGSLKPEIFKVSIENANSISINENMNFREKLNFSHLGDLISILKSKDFNQLKKNNLQTINPSLLIKHRNDIMHSRSISSSDLIKIETECTATVKALLDSNYELRWHKFRLEEIDEFKIPILHMVYPLGKNFDHLIGRQNELKKLKYELGANIPRSITGQGGLGKTALILQLVEDFLYDPNCPFENIYFMSFKNSAFENGKINRFEKSINNHSDLILRLANFMSIETENIEFKDIEIKVWDNFFAQNSLLILDNLETEIVKSNLNEFTNIAEKFIMSFNSKSRLIITSRFGLGDREAKTPLHKFEINDTKGLLKSYIGEDTFNEKKFKEHDLEWIQNYTNGNPGLILAFGNFINSTQKPFSDIRVEFDSQYTEESKVLHNQHDEFINFCFENTIDSMHTNSQKFLSMLCYICLETNLREISEEFLTYLKDEIGLKSLGEEFLRSQIFSNIGFLQPLPNSDKFIVNELLMVYLDRNPSEDIFSVYQVKNLPWKEQLDELINFINEMQFEDELYIDNLLSELYLSKHRKTSDKKYLIKSYFCQPTLQKLINIYKGLDAKDLVKRLNLMEKTKGDLINSKFKKEQEKIASICISALQTIYNEIVQKKTNKIFQKDLIQYFKQIESYIPLVKNKEIPLRDKKILCKLLNNLRVFDLVEKWTLDEPELIDERFFMLIKRLSKSSKPEEIISQCEDILKQYPVEISMKNQGQFKLYKAKHLYKENPANALTLLENFSIYFISGNLASTNLYLESLLISLECHINLGSEIEKIISIEERFIKLFNSQEVKEKIFSRNRDIFDEKHQKLKKRIQLLV